jgi:hypothetical protein
MSRRLKMRDPSNSHDHDVQKKNGESMVRNLYMQEMDNPVPSYIPKSEEPVECEFIFTWCIT